MCSPCDDPCSACWQSPKKVSWGFDRIELPTLTENSTTTKQDQIITLGMNTDVEKLHNTTGPQTHTQPVHKLTSCKLPAAAPLYHTSHNSERRTNICTLGALGLCFRRVAVASICTTPAIRTTTLRCLDWDW